MTSVVQMTISIYDRVEKIVRNGGNACMLPAFHPFSHFIFKSLFFQVPKPFPKRQILDPSNFKDFADSNFKFHETSQKFSKLVENAVGKGEIAR